MDLKFMEPQSRFLLRVLAKRNYDAFNDSSKRVTNWMVLLGDIAAVILLIELL